MAICCKRKGRCLTVYGLFSSMTVEKMMKHLLLLLNTLIDNPRHGDSFLTPLIPSIDVKTDFISWRNYQNWIYWYQATRRTWLENIINPWPKIRIIIWGYTQTQRPFNSSSSPSSSSWSPGRLYLNRMWNGSSTRANQKKTSQVRSPWHRFFSSYAHLLLQVCKNNVTHSSPKAKNYSGCLLLHSFVLCWFKL